MNELANLLLTFVPLFLVLILANLAQRARVRDAARAAAWQRSVAATSLEPADEPLGEPPGEVAAPALPAAYAQTTTSDAEALARLGAEQMQAPVAAAAAQEAPGPLPTLPGTPPPPPPADDSGRVFALLAYLLLGGLYAMAILAGFGLSVIAASGQMGLLAESPMTVESPGLLAWGLILPGLFGILLLLPPVRRLCARFIPIDPANPVHAIALSMSMLVFINMLLTLAIGLGNISSMLTEAQNAGETITSFVGVWGQQALMALLGFVGVGWLIRRNGRQSLERLGLVRPTGRQVLLGLGLALFMVGFVFTIQAIAGLFGLGMDSAVEDLTEQLLGPLLNSPFGIITLGLAAALGEETLMRGAAQPRLGLVLTAGLFALLHSNYGITLSTAVVFVLGLVLGWVRIRHNTSTAMVLHATYNMLIGLIAFLAANFLQGMGQ